MKQIIIVGAGILGASTAYHLSQAGVKVIVVDRQDAGQATDAAAGIICPWLSQRRNKAWYELAKSGAKYYSTLIEQLKIDGETETGYKRVGAISLHTDEVKLNKMAERAIKRREAAPEIGDVVRVSPVETSALFPPLDKEYESIHVSGAARVNGRALRNALVNASKKNGVIYIEGSAELVQSGDVISGVHVDGELFSADCVLVTAGAWASELLAPLNVAFQVRGQKAQIVHLQLENMKTDNWPVVIPANDQYILAFDDGKIVIGATHEDDEEYNCRVTAGGVHEVLNKALSVAPGLDKANFVEVRVGFRPVTPNFLPVIGEVPDVKGLFLANGLGASGLTVGPYLGKQLAQLALGEQTEIDLNLYEVSNAISS